jgi:hypothetical protein
MTAIDKLKEAVDKENEAIARIEGELASVDEPSVSLFEKMGYHKGRRDILEVFVEVFEEKGDRND